MAHTLLPAAGRSKLEKTEGFAFHTVREYKDAKCRGFDCENIPQYLYHHKFQDPFEEAPCRQQQQPQLQQHQQQQQQQQQQLLLQFQQQQVSNQGCNPNFVMGPGAQPYGDPNTNRHREGYTRQPAQVSKYPTKMQKGNMTGKDQKKPTVPMSNCQPLCCAGTRCACLAPEDALWGTTVHDTSTCAWKQGRETSRMRVPDPQVVRPLGKKISEEARPTGHPYFTHGRPCCPPHQAPVVKPSGFNFEQWLATTQDREPPEHLKDKCISSMCTMCGPLTVDCCPGYQCPQNYLLAKMG